MRFILIVIFLFPLYVAQAEDVITAVPIVLNSSTNFISDQGNIIDLQKNKFSSEPKIYSFFKSQKLLKKFIKWENNLLKYNKIEITGLKKLSKDLIFQEIFPEGNPWIWGLSTAKLKQQISNLPWVENVEIRNTLYPARLFLNIKEVQPWLIADFGKTSWLVSDQGKLIQSLDSIKNPKLIFLTLDLPRLTTTAFNSGNELTPNNSSLNTAINQIKLLEWAGGFGFNVENYSLLKDSSLKIIARSQEHLPDIYFTATNLEEAKMAVKRFKNVMLDLNKRKHFPKKIDLRFERQVLVE